MSRRVESILLDDSVEIAAKTMQHVDIGALPVVDDDRLVGIVTDRDLVVRGVADGRSAAATRVADVMTLGCVTVRSDARIEECARLMREHQVHRLVAVDHEGRIVGMVSTGDLAKADRTATSDALTGILAARRTT